jgi:hypothetical protein
MKMLFPPSDRAQVNTVRKRLSQAGIACQIRKNTAAKGIFGVRAAPELLIENERDILRALRLIGAARLRQMTVIFSEGTTPLTSP